MNDEQPTVEPASYTGNGLPMAGTVEPVPGRCGSLLRKSVERYGHPRYCSCIPISGSRRCRLHNGRALSGPMSPTFKNGRYIPDKLRETYDANMADPEILSLRREIAWHRVQIDVLEKGLDEGGTIHGPRAVAAFKEARNAATRGDAVKLAEAMSKLGKALEGDVAQRDGRREVREETDLLAKLVTRENERLVELHEMISREYALGAFRMMALAVKESIETHVSDPDTKRAIIRMVSTKFAGVVGGRGIANTGSDRRRRSEADDPEADD